MADGPVNLLHTRLQQLMQRWREFENNNTVHWEAQLTYRECADDLQLALNVSAEVDNV